MGLLDWFRSWFTPRPKSPGAGERPEIVMETPGSPTIGVRVGNNLMIMDRDSYDYHFGEITLPDPNQAELDDMLSRAVGLRVLTGGIFQGRLLPSAKLIESSDPALVASLREVLRIREVRSSFGHCSCLGGPTIEVLGQEGRLALISLQHGQAIRWPAWGHDAQLRDGSRLTRWLIRNGVIEDVLDFLYRNPFGYKQTLSDDPVPEGPPLSADDQFLYLVSTKHSLGHVEAAKALVAAAIARSPDSIAALEGRGWLAHQEKNYGAAVEDLGRAIELGSRNPNTFYHRAMALDLLGASVQALDDCDRALELDPAHAGAYNSRSFIRLKLNRVDAAFEDTTEAIRLAPNWHLPYANRGQIHLNRDDPASAIDDFGRALERMGWSEDLPEDAIRRMDPEARETAAQILWARAIARRKCGHDEAAQADVRDMKRLGIEAEPGQD